VDIEMWRDDKFRQLSPSPPSAQALWLYLLVGKHTTMLPGVVLATPAEIFATLGWPATPAHVPEGCARAIQALAQACAPLGYAVPRLDGDACLQELEQRGMALVNPGAGVIYLPKALSRNPPHSHKAVAEWRDVFDSVPECDLKEEIYERFHDGLADKGSQWVAPWVARAYVRAPRTHDARTPARATPGTHVAAVQRAESIDHTSYESVAPQGGADTPLLVGGGTPPPAVTAPTDLNPLGDPFAPPSSQPSSHDHENSPFIGSSEHEPEAPAPSVAAEAPGLPQAPPNGESGTRLTPDDPGVQEATQGGLRPEPYNPADVHPEDAAAAANDPSPHKAFIEVFHRMFEKLRDEPPTWGPKEGKMVKTILKRTNGDLTLAIKRVRRMFSMYPKFPAENPDLGTLIAHWDKFAPLPKRGSGAQGATAIHEGPTTVTEAKL
jgi:hypothetical protein